MRQPIIFIIILSCQGCGCEPQIKYMTIENKRSESLKIYVDGELKQPEIKGNTTTRLSDKVFAGGSIRVVAKAAKGGTELWKKEYRGEEMDEIRKDDELYVVVPDLK